MCSRISCEFRMHNLSLNRSTGLSGPSKVQRDLLMYSKTCVKWPLKNRQNKDIMPRLHLLRSSCDLFVYNFPYDFFGIVGGYKLRRMHLHCLRSPYDFFGDKLGQNLTETLRISYDNRKVIVQSSCYIHDLPI